MMFENEEDLQEALEECANFLELDTEVSGLSTWEIGFLESMLNLYEHEMVLTSAQNEKLYEIFHRVHEKIL